ncbi:MAG: GPR endopeptidase [Clostridia bacterium]|nr:GPR endopeptidase [Clostridia bacterium]
MEIRTDLALEAKELDTDNTEGIKLNYSTYNDIQISRMKILSDSASNRLKKEKGTYITIEMDAIDDDITHADDKIYAIANELENLLPQKGTILVAGIGNVNITADALGPKTVDNILATRHITEDIAKQIGLEDLRSVAAIAPGVLGQTGVESSELILSIVKRINPSAVIVVDALASRRLSRLGCTIQISDTGISPGAGVGNHRMPINEETMGIPVIGIGIPMVVDAVTLAADLLEPNDEQRADKLIEELTPSGNHMVVTPKNIDVLTMRSSRLTAMAINCALQRSLSKDDIIALTCNS